MIPIETAIERAKRHAPYLAESLQKFPDLSVEILRHSPEEICARLISEMPIELGSLEEEMSRLRGLKRKIHLVTAIADLSQTWSWVEVTAGLSKLADFAMSRLLYAAVAGQDIEPHSIENPLPGFFVLAVGKYGANELNYSSDIDFNIFYDPDVVVLPNPDRAERTMVRLVKSLIRGFEAITEDGYIFRTDLRLRPDPRSNAIAVSTKTAERYYVSIGQNWERAAMIKARICGGDQHVGNEFITSVLSPFIWRKNLDYAAIEDILAMKRQIHRLKNVDNFTVSGHDIKIGWGGIREIEFYAQVQQLILGGRDPDLQVSRTVDALAELSTKGYVDNETAARLTFYYGTLRRYEHCAQMIKDEQTHKIPSEKDAKYDFYALLGFENEQDFDVQSQRMFVEVNQIFADLFPEIDGLSSREGNLVFTGVEAGPQTLKTLNKLGYKRSNEVWVQMADWLGGRIPATRSERARELLTKLAPLIIEDCADTGRPDQAFFLFAEFFTRLRVGVNLLSMFVRQPERLNFLIKILAASPYIGQTLSSRPQILDALADPNFLDLAGQNPGAEYSDFFAKSDDFELAMNMARRVVREDLFRVCASVLSKKTDIKEMGPILSEIAEQSIVGLLPVAIREVERRSGPIEGSVGVLGMGKLGGKELSLISDLDIMLIYQPAPNEANAQQKYTKIAQRLVSALSSQTEEGRLYEVDLALRPSGKSGPVAVSVDAFTSYYQSQAWTWEFMALSKARVIGASNSQFYELLKSRVEEAFLLERKDLHQKADIADMLLRLRREKKPRGALDVKNAIGGLRDIEFIAQSQILDLRDHWIENRSRATHSMINMARHHKFLKSNESTILKSALSFYDMIRQASAITSGQSSSKADEADTLVIGQLLEKSGKQILKQMSDHQTKVENLVGKYILN